MELKQGYKQTEVGVIPEDWSLRTIDSLGRRGRPSIKAGPFGSSLTKATYVAEGYKVYGQEQVIRRDYLYGDYFISWEHFCRLKSCAVDAGDILLSLVGTAGRLLLIPSGAPPGIINPRLMRLSFDDNVISSHYFKFLFESDFYQSLLSQNAQGGTMGVLNARLLRPIAIPLPTLAEQKAIAGALSDADAWIESLEQLIAKKRQIKQGAMQELLTGQTRLPGFTGEWESKRMIDICWFQEGPGVRNTQFTSSGVKLLNGTNIFRGKLNLDTTSRFISEAEARGGYSHFMADEGDIVIASSGVTIERLHEKVAFVRLSDLPFCMNTSTIRFKPKANILDSWFLFQFLSSQKFIGPIGGQATGSAQLNFGPSHVAKVEVELPPLREQTAIATVLSDMDAEIEALEAKFAKAGQIKQGMMQELLTGRTRLVIPPGAGA